LKEALSDLAVFVVVQTEVGFGFVDGSFRRESRRFAGSVGWQSSPASCSTSSLPCTPFLVALGLKLLLAQLLSDHLFSAQTCDVGLREYRPSLVHICPTLFLFISLLSSPGLVFASVIARRFLGQDCIPKLVD
jgi:hypothetical protein